MLQFVLLKNSISVEELLSALYELLYIHEHNFSICPLEECLGTVLVVEITVFGHSLQLYHGVHPPSLPKGRSGRCR